MHLRGIVLGKHDKPGMREGDGLFIGVLPLVYFAGNGCVRDVRRQNRTSWPSRDHCPWDSAKLKKYQTPQAVKDIVTKTVRRYPESRPTLQELLDVFELWERCLNGIEVELVGEGGSNVRTAGVVGALSLPLSQPIAAPHCSVECKNTEGPDLGELRGTELEEDMELGLLVSKVVTSKLLLRV